MLNYLLKRLLIIVPMLLGITLLTYLVMASAPGGPITLMTDLNPKISPETKERLIKLYDLDKPIHVQYLKWVGRIARFDFGTSFKDSQPVMKKIGQRLPKTVLLSGLALLISFFFAIPIGIISALKHNTWLDRALTVFVFLGFSIPTYWLALLLMIFFGITLGWLPLTGFRSINADDMTAFGQIIDIAKHLVLPLLISGFISLAGLSRYMRNGMLEVIRQDYIRTARAKGLSENRVVFVHALRNTLIPVITILGLSLPDLISGAVIFETIFSYPGLGRLAYEAVMARDFPVIMATVIFGTFLTLVGNLIADISYAYADPRIRYR
ncbi:MAG: ABC transporter permease [Elusimicrobia bacterium]|nr:ABC transporter permease [Candidatus Obscuribacterium magneticum]